MCPKCFLSMHYLTPSLQSKDISIVFISTFMYERTKHDGLNILSPFYRLKPEAQSHSFAKSFTNKSLDVAEWLRWGLNLTISDSPLCALPDLGSECEVVWLVLGVPRTWLGGAGRLCD